MVNRRYIVLATIVSLNAK